MGRVARRARPADMATRQACPAGMAARAGVAQACGMPRPVRAEHDT